MDNITLMRRLVDRVGTQAVAAEMLGISQPAVSLILNGRRNPTDTLMMLTRRLLKELKTRKTPEEEKRQANIRILQRYRK